MRLPKYRNKKVVTEDGSFDSKGEYNRWLWLKAEEQGGLISELRRQVPFTLLPSQTKDDGKKERPVLYKADFVYQRDGKLVVEDFKGRLTPEYIIKRKLMLFVHGITVKEITREWKK